MAFQSTPVRTLSISELKSGVLKLSFFSLKMTVKSGLKFILKFTEPLQRYLLSCQANSAILGRYFCTGQQQLLRGLVNFKINFRPLFTIIFKLKNVNFKTRDFCLQYRMSPSWCVLCSDLIQTFYFYFNLGKDGDENSFDS